MTTIEELERLVAILSRRAEGRDRILPDSQFYTSITEAIEVIEERIEQLKEIDKK